VKIKVSVLCDKKMKIDLLAPHISTNTLEQLIFIHLHSPFPDWLSDTLIPDESFYATMARIRGTDPDTHQALMDHKTDTLHGFCPRISLWRNKETCSGSVIRDICNFGFGDLYDLWQSDCWFANKFNLQVDANAVICHVQHLMELNKYQIWK